MDDLTLQFQQINEFLKKAENVLITSHENPDADAVGSSLALHFALEKKGIKSFIYLPDFPSESLNFLPGFDKIQTSIEFFDFDCLFCLDYGDFKKLRLPKELEKKKIITIDHHLKSDQRGEIKIIEPKFSSTSEIIYLWLENFGIKIDKEIATCLLTGIVSDSGGFSHFSTSPQTFKISADLVSIGVPLSEIIQKTLTLGNAISCSEIWARVLSRITEDKQYSATFSWVSLKDLQECNANLSDLKGMINLISNASSTNLSLFLIEYEKGKIKGSLRSEPYRGGGKGVVSIAQALGGGGHLYAAGFSQEGTIKQVLEKVYQQIESV